jgi:chaperonin cofactor prefoldin
MNTGTHNHQDDGHPVPPSFANPLGEPAHGVSAAASEGAKLHELEQTLDDIEVAVDQIRTEILDGDEHAIELMHSPMDESSGEHPPQEMAKVALFNVDKWNEEYKVRIDALRQSVDELNAKLDAFKRRQV